MTSLAFIIQTKGSWILQLKRFWNWWFGPLEPFGGLWRSLGLDHQKRHPWQRFHFLALWKIGCRVVPIHLFRLDAHNSTCIQIPWDLRELSRPAQRKLRNLQISTFQDASFLLTFWKCQLWKKGSPRILTLAPRKTTWGKSLDSSSSPLHNHDANFPTPLRLCTVKPHVKRWQFNLTLQHGATQVWELTVCP